jgi:hypothetical protein
VLGLFGGVGAAALLAACGAGTTSASSGGTSAAPATTSGATGTTSGSGDLTEHQLATMSGDASKGYVAALTIGV